MGKVRVAEFIGRGHRSVVIASVESSKRDEPMMQQHMLMVMLVCGNAVAASPPAKPEMQPASMRKRVQILLHNPSRSALADVLHGPYPTGARPAYQRMIIAVTMVFVSPILHEMLCGLLVGVRPYIVMHGQGWANWICDKLNTEPGHVYSRDTSYVQGCKYGSYWLWFALCDRVPGAILLVFSYCWIFRYVFKA